MATAVAHNMAPARLRARKQRIFHSVFQTEVSQPTPVLASTEPGEPFGGPSRSSRRRASLSPGPENTPFSALLPPSTQRQQPDTASSDQVRFDRAWHAVTSRIQLPSSVTVEDSFGGLASESQHQVLDASFHEALPLVLESASALPGAAHTEDLLTWHLSQVRQHFVNHVLPLLMACAGQSEDSLVLRSTIDTLQAAHRQYLYGLSLIIRGYTNEPSANKAMAKFNKELAAIVGNSWVQGLTDALRSVLSRMLQTILRSGVSAGPWVDTSGAREELLGLATSLREVGLAGDKFHVLFAEIMDHCMEDFIRQTYAGKWDQEAQTPMPQGCMEHLSDWVENHFGRLAVEVFSRIGGNVAWADVERWRDVATGRLATLRIHELYDIVLGWPSSKSGLEDLRTAIATPRRRLQLTDAFSSTMHRRLLHTGRCTLDIMRTYISMIRTFHALDHSKVLLDRVAHALQLYLCQREDAVRIVITGLLSDAQLADDPKLRYTTLVELAVVLNEASQQKRQVEDDGLDWDDMDWVPDPIDAGVNYKRPKREDIIGTLISALGSGDSFIKEFQLILSDRLLSNTPQATLHQEAKVLNLLKKRFGDNAVQNCDVMMKDIQDSKRVDALLGKSMRSVNTAENLPTMHSQILSRLYWPSLSAESFEVPPPVGALQKQYAAGFEGLKHMRKLDWLDNLGTATVQLDLEDRTIELECKTYEAAVIYAFQSDSPEPPQHTFNDLWERLRIDEDLLEAALKFWTSKRVLRDLGDQTYTVLERLDDSRPEEEESVDGPATADSPRKGDNKEKERRAVYWQFIKGMLTNSAPSMPLAQMMMMMKMLMPDGAPSSNEELQEFLAEKVAEMELELAGGKYRLPKK